MPGDHEPVLIDDPPLAGELGQTAQLPPLEPDVNRSVTSTRRGLLVPAGAAAATILVAGVLGLAKYRTPSEPVPMRRLRQQGRRLLLPGRPG